MNRSNCKVFLVVCLVSLIGTVGGMAQRKDTPSESLDALVGRIKPKPFEEMWKLLPWMTNLVEGQKMAQALNRPMLLWIASEEPLERC